MSYKHKYEIMYNDFFFFLSLLPDTDYKYINYDINFYKNVITNNNSVFRNDIDFLYRLYRIFFIKYFTICIFDFSLHKQSERLSNVLLMQGPSFIKSLFDIKFCKNKIKIIPISNNRWVVLNKIMTMCSKNYCSIELLSQVKKMDNLYKYLIE